MWQLNTRKQTQPVPHRANNIQRLLQWSKSFHQLQWGQAQASGNKAFLMFFHALWLFFCLFVHFLLSILSVGSVVSPAINRIACRLLCNKTPISSSATEATEKQLLTKENIGITCLLRICWRLVYKSFCRFWLWLKCHLKLPPLVFNPFSPIVFSLRRAS